MRVLHSILPLLSGAVFFAFSVQVSAQCSSELDAPCSTDDPARLESRKALVTELYEGLVYPHPKPVLADPSTVGHIFEQSVVKGRVTPAGKYNDFEGAVEYFYGLALTPQTRMDDIKVRSIVASGDMVAVEVDLHACQTPYEGCDPSVPVGGNNSTIRQTGFYQFNDNDKIISFDLTILNLGQFGNVSTAKERLKQIVGVCTMLTKVHYNVVTEESEFTGTCTEEFDSADDFPEGFNVAEGRPLANCIKFMRSIPFGTWDQPASNTFTCRSLHSLLTPLRPFHCMHVNADGGGKCVDHSYAEFFETEF